MAPSGTRSEPPLIVILGPTASGKTGLAIELAKRYGGEVICADSRTVYEGMDIGTAKPTIDERAGVLHWGLDLIGPDRRFSAAEFQAYAKEKIADIRRRGKVPFLVGGTGLYIDSVVFNYDFPRPLSEAERARLSIMSKEDLYKYCIENNIELPIDDKNKRRLVHAIETTGQTPLKRNTPAHNTIIAGLATDKDILRKRIADRTEQMFKNGVVDEAIMLGKKYGWETEAMTSNVYRSIRLFLEGGLSIEEVKNEFMVRDWQLAKRQMTWFRRNVHIEWCTLKDGANYLTGRLESE